MTDDADVVIVGAGPAGATPATLLAAQGHRVVVLEKHDFPRFQIGESLLPVCLSSLDRLGFEPHPDVCLRKQGAVFVDEAGGLERTFNFPTTSGGYGYAYQVDRAAFDAQLLALAQRAGAEAQHGQDVRKVEFFDDCVKLQTSTGELRARYLLDATGQGRLLAKKLDSAVPYEGFGRASAYTHFSDVSQSVFDEFGPGNHIRIFIWDGCWGWAIPLPNRRLSVGVVTRRRGVREDLDRFIAESPLLRRWTRGAARTPAQAVSGFSFLNSTPIGKRFCCIGDSACFLDPVFSSGVSLALVGAERAADVLGPALSSQTEHEPELMKEVSQSMQRGYDAFLAIIDRFYHSNLVKHFIFGMVEEPEMKLGMLRVLAGDVWRDDNRFQGMLVSARRQPRRSEGGLQLGRTSGS